MPSSALRSVTPQYPSLGTRCGLIASLDRFPRQRLGIPRFRRPESWKAVLVLITAFINTKRPPCCTGLNLQNFSGPVIPVGVENGPFAPRAEPSDLEERVTAQAIAIDPKQAVLACLTGVTKSHRQIGGERVSWLKNLGVPGSRTSGTGALSKRR
jgi:hypothetical protein